MSFRRSFLAGLAGLTAIGGSATPGASAAGPASAITLPGDLAFPESLAASSDGTLFIGFGVLVDEHAGMLWTWVAQGQIGVLYDIKHPTPPKLPFLVVPVPVPLAVKP